MTKLLKSIRRKILGETRVIPAGVGATILLACVTHGLLPDNAWQTAVAFALPAAIIATLVLSLPADLRRANNRHAATQPGPNTTTRNNT